MAKPSKKQPPVKQQPALPELQPTHPVVSYLQDQLGAQVQNPVYPKPYNGLPANRGNADTLNAVANLPVEQGGLQGSNLATRPELYLGKTKPDEFLIGDAAAIGRTNPEALGSTGETWHNPNNGKQQVYINMTRPLKGFAQETKGSSLPFLPTVHEMYHATDNKPMRRPEGVDYTQFSGKPMHRAIDNFRAQNSDTDHAVDDKAGWQGLQQLAADAGQQVWPSTVENPGNDGVRDNIEESVATAFGLESVLPRGQLPWDTQTGAALFNTPERKGLYVEATRSGREPIARNPDLYRSHRGTPDEAFRPDFEDYVQKTHAGRGLGIWNSLMNARPVNQVVRDWLK